MQPFTELLLLLVACTLPPFFVNGFQALQPSVKNDPLQRDSMIPGLLVPRKFSCESGADVCGSSSCCPINWNCCKDGSCCEPSFYCAVGSNGIIGCCPDGDSCTGSVGGHTTIDNLPSSSPTSTKKPRKPPTTTTHTSSKPHSTSHKPPKKTTTHSSSTTTVTTLLGGPTQSIVIDVSVLDPKMNWSANWNLQNSSCDPQIKAMFTTTGNSSFTYLSNDSDTSLDYFYFMNVANSNAKWEIFVNGVSQKTYSSNSSGFANCTYFKSSNATLYPLDVPQNVTVVVLGSESETLDRSSKQSDSWSLEVNALLIQEINSTASTTTAAPSASKSSAAGRAQPYRPLLVPGTTSIFLAAVMSILRL